MKGMKVYNEEFPGTFYFLFSTSISTSIYALKKKRIKERIAKIMP